MTDEAVGTVGRRPAIEAVRAALGDDGYGAVDIDPAEAESVGLVVVAAPAGDGQFTQVNAARDGPWLAVELGGIGGVAVEGIKASVAVLGGGGPCYDCLRSRVRSTAETPSEDPGEVASPDARLAGAHAGRIALEILEGTDRAGTVVELPYAERRLWPVPGCACAGGRSRTVDRNFQAVDLETTVARAELAVDSRLGPVVSIGEAESFPAPYYLAELCDTGGFSDVRAAPHAAGVASDWNPAFVKAVGEALERYAAGVYRTSDFEVAPASALDDAVAPTRFVRPDGADPDPNDPISWVTGEDLETGASVSLPAERVQFPPTAERLGPAITTGLALGTSGADAIVSGLTEVIERDATMLAWFSTYEPLALSVDDPGYAQLAKRAGAEGLSVTALLVTQDIDIPVITAVVHRDDAWPRFAVGSGAGLDPVAAARGALEEALQNWMELRGMGQEVAAEEESTVARYAEFPREARQLVEVEETVPIGTVGPDEPPMGADALAALVDRLAGAGLDAYAARLTTRDLEAIGFEAVRVLAPAAQPLFTGERFFGERARTVPRSLGFRPRLDRSPHPYP